MTSQKTLHLLCDFREPSVARAAQEARKTQDTIQIGSLRTGNFAPTLNSLLTTLADTDSALICLLHSDARQLREAGSVLEQHPISRRQRIRLSSSAFSPQMHQWAKARGIPCETNPYENSDRASWAPQQLGSLSRNERHWLQYRLMEALIAGTTPQTIYAELITVLRDGSPTEEEQQRALNFVARGEPDMAGGNYAEERRDHPNAIDVLRDRTVQIGRSGLNSLIIGETGTGKESLAWYIHNFSLRRNQPFLALNCAFFEGERLEAELFGYEQGAFTDAKKKKIGLVEMAHGGTVFLDELPEMTPRVQAKLLRFLQDGSYSRLGGNQTYRADVRVISAAQPQRLTTLRSDLHYRIAEVELVTVPLRQLQPRDVVNVACNLAYRLMWTKTFKAEKETILTPDLIRLVWQRLATPEATAALSNYAWPGNMRELSSLIKRFVLLDDDIFSELAAKCSPAATENDWNNFLLPVTSLTDLTERGLKLSNLPSAYLNHLASQFGGKDAIQPTKLAQALDCSYNTLMNHLKK